MGEALYVFLIGMVGFVALLVVLLVTAVVVTEVFDLDQYIDEDGE